MWRTVVSSVRTRQVFLLRWKFFHWCGRGIRGSGGSGLFMYIDVYLSYMFPFLVNYVNVALSKSKSFDVNALFESVECLDV